MGLGLVRDNSVLEPLHNSSGGGGGGTWSRTGEKISLSNGGTTGGGSVQPPAKRGANALGPEILALLDAGEHNENDVSLLFQLRHTDNLYTRYFKHMNAGRVKVSVKAYFIRSLLRVWLIIAL